MLCKASTYLMTVFLAAIALLVKQAEASPCEAGYGCGPTGCEGYYGYYYCPYGRRSLQELTGADILTEEEVDARLGVCGEFMHNLDLAITSQHLLFYIQPSAEAEEVGCLPMAIHSSFEDSTTKQVLGFTSMSALEDIGFTTEHGVILDMSSFTLENIMEAYRMASAVPEGVDEHAAYDVIDNNCGGFLVNMLNNLNYQYPDGFAGLLASILYYQGGSDFADTIREAANQGPKSKFYKKLKKLDDTELIKWVVEHTIQKSTEEAFEEAFEEGFEEGFEEANNLLEQTTSTSGGMTSGGTTSSP